MSEFAKLAWQSISKRHKPLLDLHIHSFGCPTCPQAIKEQECVSDGKYCAFFPKTGTFEQQFLDSDDYLFDNKPELDTS